jgi:geranylgeranyl diphosphate synthase type I
VNKEFLIELQHNKEQIEEELSIIFKDHNIDIAETYGCYSSESIKAFQLITERGGKRLRGVLLMQAYSMFGGKDYKLALRAAAAIELIHAYLLIIDDFCDQSEIRRGGPSAHIYLSDFHNTEKLTGDSSHFGESIAINSAIYGMHYASNLILSLNTKPATIIKAHKNINDNLLITAHGQINDIFNESLPNVDENMIRNVLAWKTGYYTFLNPLELGAILAGASDNLTASLKPIALNLGIAFQIQDDIIGMFGDDKKSGKSNMDDLREGKMTLLIENSLQKSNQQDQSTIHQALGNQELTNEQHKAVQEIIVQTGTLDLLKTEANQNIEYAIEALNKLSGITENNRDFIINIALYIKNRAQ